MPMGIVITFSGNYCVGEENTINKSISKTKTKRLRLFNYLMPVVV